MEKVQMRNLVVLIPEGFYVNYFVYSTGDLQPPADESYQLQRKGRIRSRDSSASSDDIRSLMDDYRPKTVAIRVLYGGERFRKPALYDRSILPALEELVPDSPLHIPPAIRLIKTLERAVPVPDMLLLFETAFFVDLPIQERTYALDIESAEISDGALDGIRRFGYHGLYHEAAYRRISRQYKEAARVISICLEPVPEVVGIYDGRPVYVSGGSTPMEGIPGNTTCGEIDPGIVLLIEEKKKLGPETINEMLTRNSGLTAVAGQQVTIEDIFEDEEKYKAARDLLEYRVLLSCGAAIALMGGYDAMVFSGKYGHAAEKLSKWLTARLAGSTRHKARQGTRTAIVGEESKPVLYVRDPLDRIIAADYCRLAEGANV